MISNYDKSNCIVILDKDTKYTIECFNSTKYVWWENFVYGCINNY